VKSIGLDPGSYRIVAAVSEAVFKMDNVSYSSQLNASVTLPYRKATEIALQGKSVPHTIDGSTIRVYGNESIGFANVVKQNVFRPMAQGVLDPDELEHVKVFRELAACLAGKAEPPQRVCFTIPAAPLRGDADYARHEMTIRNMLSALGFTATSIDKGLAVVYAEMASTNYTGIGINIGGALSNVCLAYLAKPLISFSIAKAGDFVDARTAAVTGESLDYIRMMKSQVESQVHSALRTSCDEVIAAVLDGLRDALANQPDLPLMRAIPLVLSGGTTLMKGFPERFENALRKRDLPVKVSKVRRAENPLTASAKGALAAALSN
jgi:hypothetical protein